MANIGMWKYFTPAHHREYLLSLNLLAADDMPPDRQLRYLYAVARHTERHYTRFLIPRRDGTSREILAPDSRLKTIQRQILHRVLPELPLSPHATAYRKGYSVVQNAGTHCGKQRVLKMDIQDFFGSITFLMVYRSAFPRTHFPPSVATLLANLCCYRDYLPQGAPTSAAISNLVMKPFDDYMARWCGERGIAYTRYCDDMTFSGEFDSAQVIRKVRSFLLSMGFVVKERKTRVMGRGERQAVTGLVVNERPQLTREYRDKLRQELYYCRKFGAQSHLARQRGLEGPPERAEVDGYLHSLLGKLNYVCMVDPGCESFARARADVRRMLCSDEHTGEGAV